MKIKKKDTKMSEREYDCYCDDLEYQQSNGKRTHSEIYGKCQFCYDEIEAQDCVPQFFKDKSKYDVITLDELQDQIQKLTNEVANLKQHLKLLIMDSK